MIYIPEKEEIIQKKKWRTEYSRAFFNNQRKNGDKLMVFGSGFSYHGFIINEDSKLFGFGWNDKFQLGLGDNIGGSQTIRTELSEVKFFSSKPIKKISCGNLHSVFLTKNNEVHSTGFNSYGQLGVGDFDDRKIPARVSVKDQNKVVKVIDIFAGSHSSFVLSNLLEIYSFGSNDSGELGVGDRRGRKTAQRIQITERIISVSCGCFHSFFITIKGDVFVCGDNSDGQLGISSTSDVINPKKILFFKEKKILQVSCGWGFTLFVTEDNQVYGTGKNKAGQLGVGNKKKNEIYPCLLASLKDEKVIYVKCAEDHSFFKCKNKIMLCGSNHYGQLDTGNYNSVYSPRLFKLEKEFIQSLLLNGSSIYFTKGEVYGCGRNSWGQLFCGNNTEKNPNIFKIRNLKVKKRICEPNIRKQEEFERFEYLTLLYVEGDSKLLLF